MYADDTAGSDAARYAGDVQNDTADRSTFHRLCVQLDARGDCRYHFNHPNGQVVCRHRRAVRHHLRADVHGTAGVCDGGEQKYQRHFQGLVQDVRVDESHADYEYRVPQAHHQRDVAHGQLRRDSVGGVHCGAYASRAED